MIDDDDVSFVALLPSGDRGWVSSLLFIIVGATTFAQLLSFSGATAGLVALIEGSQLGQTTISVAANNVETKFICMSSGLPGELVKISSWPQG